MPVRIRDERPESCNESHLFQRWRIDTCALLTFEGDGATSSRQILVDRRLAENEISDRIGAMTSDSQCE
jgi:hypothetical protein